MIRENGSSTASRNASASWAWGGHSCLPGISGGEECLPHADFEPRAHSRDDLQVSDNLLVGIHDFLALSRVTVFYRAKDKNLGGGSLSPIGLVQQIDEDVRVDELSAHSSPRDRKSGYEEEAKKKRVWPRSPRLHRA
jgi:hypothetical protein